MERQLVPRPSDMSKHTRVYGGWPRREAGQGGNIARALSRVGEVVRNILHADHAYHAGRGAPAGLRSGAQREITSRRSPHGENRGGLALRDAGAASTRARGRSHTRLRSRSRSRSPFDSLGRCRRIGPRSSPSLVGSGASIISSKVVSSSAKAAMTIASTGVSLLVLPEVRTKSSRCDSIAPKTRSLRSARVPRARPASMQLP